MSRSSGLGAALNPACLVDPISFYAVTDGFYYRHPGGRVFRLMLDRVAIQAANDSESNSPEEALAEAGATVDFREVPPDVIAHAFSRPLATWQLESELGEEIAELAHGLADDIDVHVDACPLATVAPAVVAEPVLQLTCDLAITVLAAIEPATVPVLATALRGRGVIVDHEGKLRAKLLALAELDDVERDVPPDGSEAAWTCTDRGRSRASRVRASLLALAD